MEERVIHLEREGGCLRKNIAEGDACRAASFHCKWSLQQEQEHLSTKSTQIIYGVQFLKGRHYKTVML